MSVSCLQAPAIACLTTLALFFGGDVKKAPHQDTPKAAAHSGEPSPAHLRIVSYSVELPPEAAEGLDSGALADSARQTNGLRIALEKFGKTVLTSLIDQDVDLGVVSKFTIGSSTPIPSGSQTFKGQTSTQVQYQEIGCIFSANGKWNKDETRASVWIEAEFSSVSESAIKLSPDSHAPIFHKAQQSCFGSFSPGTPRVFVTIDGANSKGGITAYVTSITVTPAAK